MIGLGTYAYFWQHSDRVAEPLSLIGAFEATRAQDVGLFQICDYAPLLTMTAAEIADAAAAARDLDLVIELGTKGIEPGHLESFLRLADAFDARLVRSMLYAPESRPSLDEAERMLRTALPAYEAAGVTLALETYEQVATDDLVGLVERIGSDHLGICLDPGTSSRGWSARGTSSSSAAPPSRTSTPRTSRSPARTAGSASPTAARPWAPACTTTRTCSRPSARDERGINQIVEHWLPWQGDPETTITTEREWTRTTLEYLRSMT